MEITFIVTTKYGYGDSYIRGKDSTIIIATNIPIKTQRSPKPLWLKAAWVFTSLLMLGCAEHSESNASENIPVFSYKTIQAYPHDQNAFTQGLLFKDGYLYESTGLKGHSTVRRVNLEDGKVLKAAGLEPTLYGEGLAAFGDDLILLTWKAETGFVLNRADLSPKYTFQYKGDGWGLASSSDSLFMSDGSSFIRVLDPQTLQELSRFQVTERGEPIDKLNELEWVNGELYANIWKSDKIAKINPISGAITGWIDLTGLFKDRNPKFQGEDVLNGIAFDETGRRLFVTGKLWPYVYEIEITTPL